MDPIHPIIPVPLNIPPVTAAPLSGRIDRDDRRRGLDDEKRRRRPAAPHATPPAGDQGDDDADAGLHINVTA